MGVRLVWIAAAVCVLGAACSSSKHTSAPSTTTTTSATIAATTTTTGVANSTTTVTELLPTTSLPCQPVPIPSVPEKSPAPGHAVNLTNVAELGDTCVDHVVFSFTSSSPDPPAYTLSYGTPPFTSAAEGAVVPIKGTAFVVVRLEPAYGYNIETGVPTYTGPQHVATPHAKFVTEVVRTGDEEGVMTWVIGLSSKRAFTVQATGAPQTQLVVTIS